MRSLSARASAAATAKELPKGAENAGPGAGAWSNITTTPTAMTEPWSSNTEQYHCRTEVLKDYEKTEPHRLHHKGGEHPLVGQRYRAPYTEVKRFDWMRGYHVGGRSLMWGRHSVA